MAGIDCEVYMLTGPLPRRGFVEPGLHSSEAPGPGETQLDPRAISIQSLLWLSAALACGCATRYLSPEISESHGTLAFPSEAQQVDRRVFIEPLEFNDLPRPRKWVGRDFRVAPGELRLAVRAARESLQGQCRLTFRVAEGETYRVEAEPGEETFSIRATHHGRVVAECAGPATTLPTPMRWRGVTPFGLD